jgi:HlyD family secretion protein
VNDVNEMNETARDRRRLTMSRKRLLLPGAGVLALLLIIWMILPAAVEVEVGLVSRGPMETVVESEGVTRVRDRYQIAAPVNGRLERIQLREGDSVPAGAVLARITPMPLDPQATAQARAQVAAAQAGTQEAQARVNQAREQAEQAERTAARLRALAEAGGVSQNDVEQAELQVARTVRELQAAQSRARAIEAELAGARAALVNVDPAQQTGRAVAVVRSPAAGRVLRVHETSERIVSAGTPLIQVGDAMGLEVVVDVLSNDAVRIQTGAPMRLINWGGESTLEGRVRLVEPAGFTRVSALGVDEQRVNVLGDIQAAPASLGDGYRVEAQIITWQADDVLRVPNSAIFRGGAGWRTFVMDGRVARLRTVRTGQRGAEYTQVLDGLTAGEKVILFPSDLIQDGTRVRRRS